MEVSPIEASIIEAQVIEAIRTVYDAEIAVNIYELGLVYDVEVEPDGFVTVRMTLTSPGCPAAQSLPVEVDAKVRAVPGVTDANVEVVWDPPWSMEMMSDEAKLELGLF